MSTSFMIPFDKILEKSFELRSSNPNITIEEILKEVMSTINIQIHSTIPTNIRKNNKTKDNSPRKKELTDEERCLARTVYEDVHLEKSTGTLKIMRDDPKNLYGDRCKCRHKQGGKFCTRHSGFQPLGVWNDIYYGKLQDYVEKTQHPECLIEEKPKNIPKKNNSTKSEKSNMVNKKEKKPTPEPEFFHDSDSNNEDDSVDAEPINIDGNMYYIDSENNLYSEEGDLVGIYNKKTNKIINSKD